MLQPSSPSSNLRAATRAGILEAARRRFLRFGPRKTTIDEIAREAGVSRTTLYEYFRNKEALYESLLQQDAEDFIARIGDIVASQASAGSKIHRIVEHTRHTYADNRVLQLALVEDTEMSLGPIAQAFNRDQERRIITTLEAVLQQGVDEGALRAIDPGRVAYLMFHLGRVLVERETTGRPDYPFRDIIAVMDDLFARGIAAKSGAKRENSGE